MYLRFHEHMDDRVHKNDECTECCSFYGNHDVVVVVVVAVLFKEFPGIM